VAATPGQTARSCSRNPTLRRRAPRNGCHPEL
jgi:hypothetical protein